METYIASRIPDEGIKVALAEGDDGTLTAELYPIDWGDGDSGLHWETNEPQAVGLKDIYEYFKRQEMTLWEWQQEIEGQMARQRVQGLKNEVVSLRRARADIVAAAKSAIDLAAGSAVAVEEQMKYEANLGMFRLTGDYWDTRFLTEEGHFCDLEGFRHIAKLLAEPEKRDRGN